MLARAASSCRTAPGVSAETSPGQSSCSSRTGDVLVRATQVHLCDRRHQPGPGTVQIPAQKLQNPIPMQSLSTRSENLQRPKQRQKPDKDALVRAAAEPHPGVRRALLKNPGSTKENRQPSAELSPDVMHCAGTDCDQQPDTDLLTSRFAAGGRGVVLTALKQRSHSAPHRRDVNVQLLDPEPVQSPVNLQDDAMLRIRPQDVPHQGTSSHSAACVAGRTSGPDTTHAAAAAAAAAVTAAAPLIRAQSDMEARVSQLMDGVEKLLQANRESGDGSRGLNQQTLQHLEKMHSQQLQLQSRLLESALQVVAGHTPLTSTASELTAGRQLDTAAANALSSKKETPSTPRAASTTAMETGTVTLVTPQGNGWTEQTR